MENRKKIITTINHQRLEIDCEKAFVTLANFLRNERGLTGTKVVCSEGDCGACTVLMSNEIGVDGKLKFKSVNSCILPLYLIDGAQIVTVEGLKNEQHLSNVQLAMVESQGAQCGYCTPGIVCAMSGMAETLKNENKPITEKKVRNFLTGNLCRCTGYRPIIEAGMGIDLSKIDFLKDRFHREEWLAEIKAIKNKSVMMKLGERNIFLPITLEEALVAKKNDPDLRLVAGSTDIGVVVNKGKMSTPKTMALYHIAELRKISHDTNFITVGATVTLTEFENYIEEYVPELSRILHIFASPQIKNQATLVGNVANASPIGDTIPYLMVSDALVCLQNKDQTRQVKMSEFYLGYKKLDLKSDEIITGIKIPQLKKDQKIKLYKISMRKDLDISAVTFAGLVTFDQNKKLTDVRLALGGVAATVLRLTDIEQKMVGEEFSRANFVKFGETLPHYIAPLSDLRASKEYRMLVAQNFFKKFFDEVSLCQ
jgi:xanthine dehydrogenase small subunit